MLLSLSELDKLDMVRSRRQALQFVLNTACTTLTLSPVAFLHSDSLERLQKALVNPARVDKDVLNDLSLITGSYWRLRTNASLIDLLNGISGHFTSIVDLLREPYPTPIYLQLCSLAAENAQILGEALYDIREFDLAWAYYAFSVKQAREAHNGELQAVGLGRMALLLLYCGQSENALFLIQEALQIALQNVRIRSWLAAIEAEIHASLKDYDNYRRAIDRSKEILYTSPLEPDVYATGFRPSKLLGFEGASLLRLQQSEQALPILQNTLETLSPLVTRRKARISALIGTAYAQLGDTKNACLFAHQALDIATQKKSLTTLQRIHTVKEELSPWKNDTEVKNFHEQFALAIATIGKGGDML